VDALVEIVIAVALALALVFVAYKKSFMTPAASVAAFVGAVVTGTLGGIWWEFAFILFPFLAFVATRMRFEEKKAHGLQEGKHGERGLRNILGVTVVPVAICIIHYFTTGFGFELTIAFLSALAVSTADTLASELGVRDPKVFLITTLKPCERGTNGGISRFGLAVSSAGALVFGVLGYLLIFKDFSVWLIVPGIAGIFGNLMDSLEGALFENRGLMSKYTVNASSALLGALFGFVLASVF